MDELTLGVVATSRKEHERRLPIHPRHLERIDADLRRRIFLEHGYGERFGFADDELARAGRAACARASSWSPSATSSLLPKPLPPTSRRCGPARCCGAGRTACRTPS